jgi:hypothetical protein
VIVVVIVVAVDVLFVVGARIDQAMGHVSHCAQRDHRYESAFLREVPVSRLATLASIAALALVVMTSACATALPHVALDAAPDASAPYDQRADYYKRVALDGYDGARVTLHDGSFVYWPEDLKPAVDPTSNTAKAIADVEAARPAVDRANQIAGVGGLIAAGGLVAMTGSLLLPVGTAGATNGANDGISATLPWLVGGAVATGVGSVVSLVPSILFSGDYQRLSDAAQKVLTTYPQSLSDRVAIQPDANGRLVDLAEGAGGLGLQGEKDAKAPTL